jgi:hypothetical protein
MTAVYKFLDRQGIRLGGPLSLIFFVLIGVGCQQKAQEQVSIFWEEGQARGVVIPKSLLANSSNENLNNVLQIRLANSRVPMLGRYQVVSNDNIRFKPLIPLTPGKTYEVFYKGSLIGRVSTPLPDKSTAPALVAIYPSADTLPENLLKVYLQFSAPMREGEALQHIHLLSSASDTIPNIFLDLQPELWNRERTALTVWLDPGRIKRDLVPNQQFGNPLQRGAQYNLVVDKDWKDVQGLALQQPYTKRVVVTGRDNEVPQPQGWRIELPTAETTRPLRIHFGESLDYFLLPETILVVGEKGDLLKGNIQILDKERGIEFTPEISWKPGKYRLSIATYLEDLAGNNLNRPFDRDTKFQQKKEGDFVEREFVIRDR